MPNAVLLVGIEPTTIDFSDPAYQAFANLNAKLVQAGLDHDVASLNKIGYEAELCLASVDDLAVVLESRLRGRRYDCILVGAGVRSLPKNFLLFEKVINVIHAFAPKACICFNTKPDDSAEAVQRWLPLTP